MKTCKNCGINLMGIWQTTFCSRSCSARYNNVHFPKRKLKKIYCISCQTEIIRKSYKDGIRTKYCDQCRSFVRSKELLENQCLRDVKGKRQYQKHSRIRDHARSKYLKSNNPKYCIYCGYNKHFDVCHIKAVASYSEDTLVSEINSFDNLMALCKNHHWELDHKLLTIQEIRKHALVSPVASNHLKE